MRVRPFLVCTLCSIILSGVGPHPARAQWGASGVAIATGAGWQGSVQGCSDGVGGAIYAWRDGRAGSTNFDIYVQRVSDRGLVQWTANGVAICSAPKSQYSPVILSDGSGGAIVAWQDDRAGTDHGSVFVQKVNSSGVPQWTDDGQPVATGPGARQPVGLVSDGAGGAIVVWTDLPGYPDNTVSTDLYGQHLDALGNPQWPSHGVAITEGADYLVNASAATDGGGGVLVCWRSLVNDTTRVFAQRLAADSTRLWGPAGIGLSALAGDQDYPAVAMDDSSGVVASWVQYSGPAPSGVYLQRLSALGLPKWAAEGVRLSVDTTSAGVGRPALTRLSGWGSVVTWTAGNRCLGQRVSDAGVPQWTPGGNILASPATGAMSAVRSGGVVICSWGTRAQRVGRDGNTYWGPSGAAPYAGVVNAGGFGTLVPDGAGGVLSSGEDFRNGPSNADLYAQRLDATGQPATTDVTEAPYGLAGTLRVRPNPARGSVDIAFSLAAPSRAGLEVLDIQGRRVAQFLDRAWLAAGPHDVRWDGRRSDGARLPSGVYLVRLRTDEWTRTAKVLQVE